MSEPQGVREYLLAFADDEHLMGQQHTEWIGVAPFLEEDLAFSSIGQDELGHAALLYELVLDLEGTDPTDTALDTLAFGRPSGSYRCCHLAEYTTRDWAEALVRHWIYDTFEALRWQLVAESSLLKLASVARKALQEEAFHRRHADALLDKLLASPEPRERILEALDVVGPLVEGLCEPVEGETEAISTGVAAASTADPARTAPAGHRGALRLLGLHRLAGRERPESAHGPVSGLRAAVARACARCSTSTLSAVW